MARDAFVMTVMTEFLGGSPTAEPSGMIYPLVSDLCSAADLEARADLDALDHRIGLYLAMETAI